ncbi:MAG: hypothetical protein ACLRWQ_01775 [Flavonifractor plautii]
MTLGSPPAHLRAPGQQRGQRWGASPSCAPTGLRRGWIRGDMDDTVEKRLIAMGRSPISELLVAGHHGSKYATSEELLLATTPELAVISVGYNTYGHPARTLEAPGRHVLL